jgi:iron complex transport system ATP-binding protein
MGVAIREPTTTAGDQPHAERGLQAHDLHFAHVPGQPQLAGVSLGVRPGEVLCLLGPNGTGKTTLLRCLLRLLRPDRGTVTVDGRDVGGMSAPELARAIAYVPQSGTTGFPFSVLDVVVMGRSPHLRTIDTPTERDYEIAFDRLDGLGIGHLADRTFNLVSGGERQLALIARALTQASPILIFDEPTASLDYGNQARILQVVGSLARAGHAVVMTSHAPDHALACADNVALLKDGSLLEYGPPHEVITAPVLTALYGIPIRVVSIPSDPDGAGTGPSHSVCIPVMPAIDSHDTPAPEWR